MKVRRDKKAMIREIDRQIVEREDLFYSDVDAAILWGMHVELKLGKKRLKRVYNAIIQNYKDMCKYYETDEAYPAKIKLREIGVDLEEWRKEIT